eukprot:m.40901 g.40901  ORF g.40901 m.40901 type:complete len:620 (+) comp9719_c0_seq2:89-1948(+)
MSTSRLGKTSSDNRILPRVQPHGNGYKYPPAPSPHRVSKTDQIIRDGQRGIHHSNKVAKSQGAGTQYTGSRIINNRHPGSTNYNHRSNHAILARHNHDDAQKREDIHHKQPPDKTIKFPREKWGGTKMRPRPAGLSGDRKSHQVEDREVESQSQTVYINLRARNQNAAGISRTSHQTLPQNNISAASRKVNSRYDDKNQNFKNKQWHDRTKADNPTASSAYIRLTQIAKATRNGHIDRDFRQEHNADILRRDKGSTFTGSSNTVIGASSEGLSASGGQCGLANLGNTCFMNSILQCLSCTAPLSTYFLSAAYERDINRESITGMKGKLAKLYARLLQQLWVDSGRCVIPNRFKMAISSWAPHLSGYRQQDAQEFLRFLLDGLHEDLNRVTKRLPYSQLDIPVHLPVVAKSKMSLNWYRARANSHVMDLFSGQLRSSLICNHCGNKSDSFDPFWDLSLPIPSHETNGATKPLDISRCFAEFAKEEILDGDERPTCSECCKPRKTVKKLCIQILPPILVIHLKRFKTMTHGGSKISTNIVFPLQDLYLDRYSAEDGYSYELYAVSHHFGSTGGGHYTAQCKHPTSNVWMEFNDARVTVIDSKHVSGSSAYILFYKRKDKDF